MLHHTGHSSPLLSLGNSNLPLPLEGHLWPRCSPEDRGAAEGTGWLRQHPKGKGHPPPSWLLTHTPTSARQVPRFPCPKTHCRHGTSQSPPHFISPHTHTYTDLLTTVTCLCMGISLGGPLPAAGDKARRPLSTAGFTMPPATPLPRGNRGTGLLLPSSGTLKDLGCLKVPLGFPKEFADVAVSSCSPPPIQTDFKHSR